MPILDTDTLTIIQRGEEPFYTRLVTRLNMLPAGTPVSVTIVSFQEQLRGWLEYVKRAQPGQLAVAYGKLRAFHEDFNTRPMIMFDPPSELVYERLKDEKTRVATMDLRIAAIAIAHNDVLISRNLRDFRRVPGLRVEDWTI